MWTHFLHKIHLVVVVEEIIFRGPKFLKLQHWLLLRMIVDVLQGFTQKIPSNQNFQLLEFHEYEIVTALSDVCVEDVESVNVLHLSDQLCGLVCDLLAHLHVDNPERLAAVPCQDLQNGVCAVVAEGELDQTVHCPDSL